ncbi:phosphoribosylanthranilate isomerase [Oculatella sp. LEGE 06141]|nr:phosphoribosylanthranilate isomerase [Oculatella sp. LEGE 06141]MBE9179833.1 phosphoribosylanthranilate isomerase [Oculatella sp. LEGE 06141]
MRVKICGITQPEQGAAIARLGATALGFICVPQSPRYVVPEQIRAVVEHLAVPVDRVGVFADVPLEEMVRVVAIANLNGVQLHGNESPAVCRQLKSALPGIEVIKALRVRNSNALEQAQLYYGAVDTLLLDAYHPDVLGGTGKTLDWSALQQFCPTCPWFLAGGINPDNVLNALSQIQPHGIDLSSGVEISPGYKDLDRVAQLFERLKAKPLLGSQSSLVER